jgi:hypothetical protein
LRRASLLALSLLTLFVRPALAWKDRDNGREDNVRLSLEAGYLIPVEFDPYDYGADAGFGLEIEQSPGVSFVFHLDWGSIWSNPAPYPDYYPYYYYSGRNSRGLFNWSLGGRGYLRARESLRPFGEVTAGLRLDDSDTESQGVVISPRLGVSFGRSGHGGISLSSGYDFPVRQPRLYGIVPIRLAIMFP